VSRHAFQVAYYGADPNDHTMDVEALAPALMAFGKLIRESFDLSAAVHLRFVLAGKRYHGRLNRCSVPSDVPTIAAGIDRAGPDYKFIRWRGLSGHAYNMAWPWWRFHGRQDYRVLAGFAPQWPNLK
jgi:hypothetical protein